MTVPLTEYPISASFMGTKQYWGRKGDMNHLFPNVNVEHLLDPKTAIPHIPPNTSSYSVNKTHLGHVFLCWNQKKHMRFAHPCSSPISCVCVPSVFFHQQKSWWGDESAGGRCETWPGAFKDTIWGWGETWWKNFPRPRSTYGGNRVEFADGSGRNRWFKREIKLCTWWDTDI